MSPVGETRTSGASWPGGGTPRPHGAAAVLCESKDGSSAPSAKPQTPRNRKTPQMMGGRQHSCLAPSALALFPEQIRHDLNARVASVVEAGQFEGCIQSLGQRVMIIEACALYAVFAVVRVYDGDNLIRGDAAVVVLIPQNHYRATALRPGRRGLDR